MGAEDSASNGDLRSVEKELYIAHQMLADIIEFLPDATFVVDTEGKLIAWNRAVEEMTGVKKKEVLGKGNYAYAVPFYGEARPVLLDLINNEDPETEAKYDFVNRKGNTLWCEVFIPYLYGGKGAYLWAIASPLLDENGNQYGAIESVRDITERREAEEKLRLLSSAVEQSTEGIGVADLDGNLLSVNNAFAAMHGYTPEELAGKNLSIFHTHEQMSDVEAANRQVQEIGEFSGELWHVRRDGTVFPTQMHNSLLRDEAGNPAGIIGTLRDITEHKKAEKELKEKLEELEKFNRLTVGRELRMKELKEQMKELKAELARLKEFKR